MRPIIDGHLDIALNALSYERDQTLALEEIRQRELRCADGRGTAAVSLPEMCKGHVGLAMVTVLARAKPWVMPDRQPARTNGDWPHESMAYAIAQGQLAYYRYLQQQNKVFVVTNRTTLDAHWTRWQRDPQHVPIGIVITMEGADAIIDPAQLRDWYDQGLRAVSLAHFGHSRYAAGTPSRDPNSPEQDGPLTSRGRALLGELEKFNIALDMTHLSDKSFAEAMDRFGGRVYASHSNARALADTVRQLTDTQLRTIFNRGGMVGIAFYNGMIRWHSSPADSETSDAGTSGGNVGGVGGNVGGVGGNVGGVGGNVGGDVGGGEPVRDEVGLEHVVDHIEHICQIAGDCKHVGIGSDLDGGFGHEHAPREIDSIADLQKLADHLSQRHFSDTDIDAIMHGNWLRFWNEVLPARD